MNEATHASIRSTHPYSINRRLVLFRVTGAGGGVGWGAGAYPHEDNDGPTTSRISGTNQECQSHLRDYQLV